MKALMILLIVLVLVSSYGRPSELDPTELGAYVEGFVTGRMYDEGVVGVTVAIVKDGQRIFSRGYGFDDLEAQRHVDASRSLFRPGSISKTFTWTAIMQLHEQGELDLEGDIQSYLPNVAIAKALIDPSQCWTSWHIDQALKSLHLGTSLATSLRRCCHWSTT